MPRSHSHPDPSHAWSDCPAPLELAAWCDDRLDPIRAGAVALHVMRCDACRAATVQSVEVASVAMVGASESESHSARNNTDEQALIERVMVRAADLVAAPAPLSFAAASTELVTMGSRWRIAWSSMAAAASIAAAVLGWQASIALVAKDSAVVVDRPALAAAGAPGVAATGESDESEMLVTFGLFDELGTAEFIVSGDERSES